MTKNLLLRLVRVRELLDSGEFRRLRTSRGLSLTETAELIDVTPSTLSRWERGERLPRSSKVHRVETIAHLLEQIPEARGSP